MKIRYLILLLCVLISWISLQAQTSNYVLGGGTGQLKISMNKNGTFNIHRGVNKQIFAEIAIFTLRINNKYFVSATSSSSQSLTLTLLNVTSEASSDIGTLQSRTKTFSGIYNTQPFSVTITILYNTSNPDYFVIQSSLDLSKITENVDADLAFGFDTYVNGNDAAKAFIDPDPLGRNNATTGFTYTRSEINELRMVGAKNSTAPGTVIGFFTMGRQFDKGYSASYSNAKSFNIISDKVSNILNFVSTDNGIGVVYQNIPVGTISDISTGLAFTTSLDGGLDFFWSNSNYLEANVGDIVNLDLIYDSYNSATMNDVAFQVDLPDGMTLANTNCSMSGFTSSNITCIEGNPFYKLTDGVITSEQRAIMQVPVQINMAGRHVMDATRVSNALRTIPLGVPAVILVKTTLEWEKPSVIACTEVTGNLIVKLPGDLKTAQSIKVNLTYSGATDSFETLPTSVTIPAGSNKGVLQLTAKAAANPNDVIYVNLVSTDQSFATISGEDVMKVTIKARPTCTIEAFGATTFCPGDSTTLAATSGTDYTFQWYKNNLIIKDAVNYSVVAKDSGSYTLTSSTEFCTSAPSNAINIQHYNCARAIDDHSVVFECGSINMNVKDNDLLNGLTPLITITTPPLQGKTTVIGNVVLYENISCNGSGTDQFTYSLCNGPGCTYAKGYVQVLSKPHIILADSCSFKPQLSVNLEGADYEWQYSSNKSSWETVQTGKNRSFRTQEMGYYRVNINYQGATTTTTEIKLEQLEAIEMPAGLWYRVKLVQ